MTIKDFDTKKVILEDQYKSDEYETMTLYFIAPKEWLEGLYPDAATVMVSPTRDLGEDGYEDYDWSDLELSLSDIEALIGMAKS